MTAQTQTISRKTQVRSVIIAGCVLLFFGLYVLAFLIPDVLRTIGGPTSLTMPEAAAQITEGQVYATLEGGTWVCDSIAYVRGPSSSGTRRIEVKSTNAFYMDAAGDVAVWVSLSGEVNCDELQTTTPSGYVEPMQQNTRMDLAGDGQMGNVATANTFLEMCGFCGHTNSLIGTVFGAVFTLLGVSLISWWWIKLRHDLAPADIDIDTYQENNPI